ncbi:hypothetical protein [Pseudodesulfovibrio sp. zrk46]|uniref:hypothetical protein n=1 Tax=Pseudodesulfovibrio sp. zrk46 TaxID=2725288 RepID=UPI001448B4EF|nr:hypothetical protein [Pseudodesulfovibrio sp. zrk46]QJB56213.1 hypothetical protein HFN16_07215 [Pseudodesulfovibrio sp. zrk46]
MTKRIFPAALCLILLLAVVGCASHNAVKLTYAIGQSTAPCSGDVTVFKFEDKRDQSKLGSDSNGQAINTLSDVADWVGWALFDELKAAGSNPKYRTSTVTPGTGTLITGEVLALNLNQTGTTTYAGKLTVKFMVQKDGKTVLAEKYTSEVENLVVPGYGSQSDILAETLRTLIGEALPAICAKI